MPLVQICCPKQLQEATIHAWFQVKGLRVQIDFQRSYSCILSSESCNIDSSYLSSKLASYSSLQSSYKPPTRASMSSSSRNRAVWPQPSMQVRVLLLFSIPSVQILISFFFSSLNNCMRDPEVATTRFRAQSIFLVLEFF